MINKSLTLDFWEKHIRQIEVNQHEKDGRTLAIQCTTGSLPINLSGAAVTFYAQKPDGEVLYNACTITDAATGRITYTMTEQTCAVAGTLKCWIEIIKAGATLRSFEFAVLVRAALDESEAIESTSEFTALETALADVNEVKADISTGWIPLPGVVTFNSVDNPLGTVNVPSGHGLTAGTKIKFTNNNQVIYGKIVATTSTTVSFIHEINPSTSTALYLMTNSTITGFCYSRYYAPAGFPITEDKWSVMLVKTDSQYVTSPTNWAQITGWVKVIPIGVWRIEYYVTFQVYNNQSAGEISGRCTLSSDGATETNPRTTKYISGHATAGAFITHNLTGKDVFNFTSKTSVFILVKTAFLYAELRGDYACSFIKATLAY